MSPEPTASAAEEATEQMPAWVPRAIVLFFVGVVTLWVLRELFEDLSGFLITILISFFFSFALEPAVNWLERRGFRRGLGTLIMFVIAVSLIGGFGFIVGSALAEQTTNFVDDAPELIDDLESWLQDNIDDSMSLVGFCCRC